MTAKGQTLAEFQPLYPAEITLLEACRDGETAIIALMRPDKLTPANRVRAAFIQFLARGGDSSAPVHEAGVHLRGAVLVGELNLSGVTVPYSLGLEDCLFRTEDGKLANLTLKGANLGGGLSLMGSQVNGIDGDGLRARGGIYLVLGFRAAAKVRLVDARIEGVFHCGGGHFRPTEGAALSFDRAKISGSVFLNNSFKATGEVRFLGAEIGGSFECSTGYFRPTNGDALSFDGAKISGSVFLNNGFQATGAVRFFGAAINGMLSCNGGQFKPKKGDALSFDRAKISGDVFLDGGFQATGAVGLPGAVIDGSLECRGGQFKPKHGDALSFDGAKISGDVHLRGKFRATGLVRLLGAEIAGSLVCKGGRFKPKDGCALLFNGARIFGGVHLTDIFRARGEVQFLGAVISGNLSCRRGQFKPNNGDAVSFDGTKISGNVFLNNGFHATGEVRFLGAEIGGNLECDEGRFEHPAGRALNFENAKIVGSAFLRNGLQAQGDVVLSSAEIGDGLDLSGSMIIGLLDARHAIVQHQFKLTYLLKKLSGANLRHMQCGSLLDDKTSWGKNNHLNGFTYRSLDHDAPMKPKFRIKWLEKQARDTGSYRPQPWRQLQKTLMAMGHDAEAREIGIAHEEFRYANRIVGQLPPKPTLYDKLSAPLTRGLHRIYGALAGYGYKPLKLVLFSVGIWFICSWVYWFSALAGYLGPTNPIVFQNPKYGYKEKNCIYERQEFCISVPLDNWYWLPSLPAEYTTFSPMAYSLDLILPLVDLGQEKDWGVLVPTPKKVPVEEILHFSWGHILRLIVWFEILWGWVASLMLVAVISGLVRNTRDDE
jgi:sRNA-binding regulator protein Hfq